MSDETPSENDLKRSNPESLKVIPSKELFTGKKMVMINHDDEIYRLAITKNGKLILQK